MSERLAPGVGEAFGGYTIESSLGRGGMGAVYLATHARLARQVALKVIAPELAHDEEFRARFLRETQLAASLEHPNVIPIYDAGEVDGVLYLAMRYVPGPSLRTLLRERGALSAEQTLVVAQQIGGALDAAHAAGLVHRDVKPANVLLTDSEEQAFLCDFGLAKRRGTEGMTRTGSFLGTADYAAPEQIEGGTVDGRADVYSLGCVLFHCLAGQPPFVRDTEYAVLHAHVADAPPELSAVQPGLPRPLDLVLCKAMAKKPAARYDSAGALAAGFGEAVEATRAVPRTPPMVAPARRRRSFVVVAVVLALLALGATAAVLLTRGTGGARPPSANSASALEPIVQQLEQILTSSAGSRHDIGNVLDAGFHCRIPPQEAHNRMQRLIANRQDVLDRVSRLDAAPPAAQNAITLLTTALRDSIEADIDYRNGFRYANATVCPPSSDYFREAAHADAQATEEKKKFVLVFNRLAQRFGLDNTWSAAEI